MSEPANNGMDFLLKNIGARLQRTQEEMAKHELPVLLLDQPEKELRAGYCSTTPPALSNVRR